MRLTTALLGFLLVAAPARSLAEAVEDDGDVVVVTAANWQKEVAQEKLIAVEFYAPWCGHCKTLAPEWKAAAAELKAHDIKLAKVDATVESSLAQQYGVQGYPTIKLFRKNVASEYNGPRQASGIVTYMLDQASPGARKVSAEALGTLLTSLREDAPEPVVVLFVAKESDVEEPASPGLLGKKSAGAKLVDAFMATAAAQREGTTFAWTADPAALELAPGAAVNSVAVLHSRLSASKSEPAVVPYTGAADEAALSAWLAGGATLPLVGELTARTAPRYEALGKPLLRVALATDWRSDAKGANYWLNRLRRLAKEHPAVSVVAVKPTSPLALLSEFGVPADAHPFSATLADGAKKYAAPDAWSPSKPLELASFLQAFAAAQLEPYFKSEPVPTSKAGGVTVVVGKTFETVVLDDTKDVLIEFYAPWCGHCKTLAPKYEVLAQDLAHVETLVIAKLDATANEWTHKDLYAVKGFPTIYFKPAGGKPVVYDGEREAPAMAKWLAAHATNTFDVPGLVGEKKKAKKAKAKTAAHDAEL